MFACFTNLSQTITYYIARVTCKYCVWACVGRWMVFVLLSCQMHLSMQCTVGASIYKLHSEVWGGLWEAFSTEWYDSNQISEGGKFLNQNFTISCDASNYFYYTFGLHFFISETRLTLRFEACFILLVSCKC